MPPVATPKPSSPQANPKAGSPVWFRAVLLSLLAFGLFGAQWLNGCSDINLFTLQDDIDLGQQLEQEILMDTTGQYPLLDTLAYAQSYAYLYGIRDSILATGEVRYDTRFEWKLYLVDREVLNAFCAPGGYIYVYTGLIKYLDNESQLAGVIGHEMAHADLRHSTTQLTQQWTLSVLLDALLGDNRGLLADIAASLLTLKYSRDDETEADMASVRYLCDTGYESDGAAGFFIKLENNPSPDPPEFLSTHPNPSNRVESIQTEAQNRTCPNGQAFASRYAELVASLP